MINMKYLTKFHVGFFDSLFYSTWYGFLVYVCLVFSDTSKAQFLVFCHVSTFADFQSIMSLHFGSFTKLRFCRRRRDILALHDVYSRFNHAQASPASFYGTALAAQQTKSRPVQNIKYTSFSCHDKKLSVYI